MDYFSGEMFPNIEEMKQTRAFDWNSEFSEIMKFGGFDIVIGNPPYISVESTVKDITAVNATLDPNAGDIRNARVRFVNRDLAATARPPEQVQPQPDRGAGHASAQSAGSPAPPKCHPPRH